MRDRFGRGAAALASSIGPGPQAFDFDTGQDTYQVVGNDAGTLYDTYDGTCDAASR